MNFNSEKSEACANPLSTNFKCFSNFRQILFEISIDKKPNNIMGPVCIVNAPLPSNFFQFHWFIGEMSVLFNPYNAQQLGLEMLINTLHYMFLQYDLMALL